MIKIPFTFHFEGNRKQDVDWEALGIAAPEDEVDESKFTVHHVWIKKELIRYIEPFLNGEGSYINIEGVGDWHTPLTPDEVADILNGTITIKA